MSYISLENLISKASDKGVKFGKSDPYNRLRYYTKMGWLPHMIRKKSEENNQVSSYYPSWALERLLLIENAKSKNKSNEEIEKIVKNDTKSRQLKDYITSPETRNKLISYSSVILLLLILSIQIGLIKFSGSDKKLYPTQTTPEYSQEPYSLTDISDKGTGLVKAGTQEIMINSDKVEADSLIQITFTNDYFPASRYWISEKTQGIGFKLSLDKSPDFDSGFVWWVVKP